VSKNLIFFFFVFYRLFANLKFTSLVLDLIHQLSLTFPGARTRHVRL